MAEPHHVVVDGSNLATEGRTSPSLAQLNDAVRAYAAEDPAAHIIVVVDATFEHRVSEKERDKVRKAMLSGEIVSPPAGAIGRGDAFVLRIAERTGATVLSNDSFQEFHGEHPWLFDAGRLIGGKPIQGVGWIFTPRVPIRGAKSRAATAEASAARDPESAPAKAAELARAAKKAAKKAARATKKAAKKAAAVNTSWPIEPAVPPPGRAKLDPAFSSALEEAVEEALHPDARKAKPAKKQAGKKQAAKKQAAAKKVAPEKSVKTKKDVGGKHGPKETVKKAEQLSRSGRGRKKKRVTPPPAVNEPLAFINFVAAYDVGSTIDGEVVSFTSHGAMVDVSLPGGGVLHCYIPLTGMGVPPPTKARQVLKKGEVRPFVLAGLDPPRRVAELAIAGPKVAPAKKQAPAKKAAPAQKGAGRPMKAPAKKAAAATKTQPAKKAKKQPVQKKAAVKKGMPPGKKTGPPAKKAGPPGRKSGPPVNKAASADKKLAPAKKQAAKKQPAKTPTAKRRPAKKAAKAARR